MVSMPLSPDHLRRRAAKRKGMEPKTYDSILQKLAVEQFKPANPERPEAMKAKSVRLAGRTEVIGNTAFEFDKDGICKLVPNFRTSQMQDWDNLLKRNGVSLVTEEDAVTPVAPPAPKVKAAPPPPAPEEVQAAPVEEEAPSEDKPKRRRRAAKKGKDD